MIALSVSELSLSFGGTDVLKNISFAVNAGDKVGVIGVNGAGKTSLFKIIAGEESATSGDVFIAKGYTVGHLKQNPDPRELPSGMCVAEYMYTAFPALLALEVKIREKELEISELSEAGRHDEAVRAAGELSELNSKYERLGGMEFRGRCRGMLIKLGIPEELIDREISTLSGGQYTRLALARLLATEPDILMLDEPTNHLDLDALGWLESYASAYKKTVIIISHDRYFLDKTTNKTLSIAYGRATLYPGGYTASRDMQMREAASLEKKYKEQQKEIAKIRANIEFQRRCNREHNFVTIRSKEKQLERMEKIELAPPPERSIRMSFAEEAASANNVLELRDVSFSYGGEDIIKDLSFLVRRGERVLILGRNGSGKSTLMKLINGGIYPKGGKITLGYNIKIGYYDQENRGLNENKTVMEEIHDEYPEKTDLELRSTLALFLFGAEDIDKRVSQLSGGERARLTLAKLILKKVNLLLLDEPTNHLDIGSAEALESALSAFGGTIVAVSHDRYFINSIATRIIELDKNAPGGVTDYSLAEYDDAYAEYLRIREKNREAESRSVTAPAVSAGKLSFEERKKEAARQRSEKRRIERAKERAAELEGELEALEAELFGEAATDYVRAAQIEERRAEIELELLELYEIIL